MKFALMTFTPHPSEVIRPSNKDFPYLITPYDKVIKMASLGVEQLYIVKFDLQSSRLSPQEFVKQYLIGLHCKHVVAGFDYTYGYKGAGNITQLAYDYQDEFEVTTVVKVELNNQKISSTLIRSLITSGNVDLVPDYLGHYYEIYGQVLSTNNRKDDSDSTICLITNCLLPKPGVYTITAEINSQTYEGICQEILTFDCHYMLVLQLVNCPLCDDSTSIKVKWIRLELELPLASYIPSELMPASL